MKDFKDEKKAATDITCSPIYSKQLGLIRLDPEADTFELVIHFPSQEELQLNYPSFYHPSLDPCITEKHMEKIVNEVCATYMIEGLEHFIEDFKYDLCVDLGANVGMFSIFAGLMFHRVVAIEADPYTCDYARAAIDYSLKHYPACFTDRLHYEGANIELYNLACSAKAGDIVSIYGDEEDLGEHMIYDNNEGYPLTSRRCLTIDWPRLQQLVGTKDIDYLKVDIEGSEYDFLLAQDLSDIKVIRMELHSSNNIAETKRRKKALLSWLHHNQGFLIANLSRPAPLWDNIMATNTRFITPERHEKMWHFWQEHGRFG